MHTSAHRACRSLANCGDAATHARCKVMGRNLQKEESAMLLGWLSGILVLLAGTTALAAEGVEEKNALSDLGASVQEVAGGVVPSVVEILIAGDAASDEEDGRIQP